MSRPQTVSSEKILEAAKKLFLSKGFQVSTTEIAKAVGLSQAALFKRFKNKESLFIEAVTPLKTRKQLKELIDWIEVNPTKAPFNPQLEELLNRSWALLKEIIPNIIALHSYKSSLTHKMMLTHMKNPPPLMILRAISSFVKNAQKLGHLPTKFQSDALAMNILGPLQSRAFFHIIIQQKVDQNSDSDYIKQTMEVLLNGLQVNEVDND